MPRKKANSSMSQVQGDLVAAVDQVVGGIEEQIVNHAEERLFDFVLGGGLASQLAARMMPHLEEFKTQVGAIPSTERNTLALGSGAIDVEAGDV